MIHHGDLFIVLPTLAAESVDACVTDPPYGIGFMGKEWDTFKPGTGATRKLMHPRERQAVKIASANPNINGRHRSPALSPSQIDYDYTASGLRGFQDWTAKWAAEVYRVLKPGAYIVVCGAPRSYHRMACGLEDAGFVVRDNFAWLFGSGFPKNYNLGEGKGTALKPAHEPIALAWKPFKGSIKACHEKHGTAALNIDACRVEGESTLKERSAGSFGRMNDDGWEPKPGFNGSDLGRWPANVVMDEEAAAALDEQTGELVSGAIREGRAAGTNFSQSHSRIHQYDVPADSGGASRFYYVAKPSREERDMGCYDLQERPRDDSRKEGNVGGDNPRNRGLQPRGNFHPTVKPVALMRWLVKLVTPVGGKVIDPFGGSGTTAMACVYEQRNFEIIEREAEYVELIRRRVASVAPLFTESA
jgi:DNA modification methylase